MAEEPKVYERTADVDTMDYKSITQFVKSKSEEMQKHYKEEVQGKAPHTNVLKSLQVREEELKSARERMAALRETEDAFKKEQDSYKSMFRDARLPVPHDGGRGNGNGNGAGDHGDAGLVKSIGQMFVDSREYEKAASKGLKSWDARYDGTLIAELDEASIKSWDPYAVKTTMTTSAGWAPYPALSPRPPVMTALQQPVVSDLIPQDDTTQPAILYYEETAFSDAAAPTAEGGVKPEQQLALTLRTQPICKIAATLPITDEQLMDVPAVRGYIDQRLTLMVRRAEDSQLLTGNGTSPNLQGFHTKSGIGSIARASNEDNADTILRAITDVNSIYGFANTSGIILHPLNWLAIRLIRTTTGDYIWGHPATVGPATLWGLPVVQTAMETSGKGLVGDFQMYSHISRRLGLKIDVGYINDDFQRDIQRIRLEERLSLEIYRARAFEEVTSLQ
jgi:HK97 family phage major capsid protein